MSHSLLVKLKTVTTSTNLGYMKIYTLNKENIHSSKNKIKEVVDVTLFAQKILG